ncbi:uncharacterized protein K02A2.6-like [Toxorhynchites rutilus septentrionalis]|uniref:uncharacterized protein K02A2.6-like n=1 Tax=Toxorhynchites rutilus septentrionalis TaxID=329112 RepID=UPI0024796437|nr:uncharacterized protein K02A2.6-like [Toxorhynchites rutilus septentrionalis]
MASGGGEPAGEAVQDMQTAILQITQLLQRFAVPRQPNPEHTLEALSSNISEFSFNPENGVTFKKWFARYTDLFESDAQHLDDAAKVRLLLRKMDTASHSRYLNYILPRLPKDVTFKDTVETLIKIFGEQTSLFRRRFQCLQLAKSEGDDIITYGGKVNRACEDFDFVNLTIDQFKCLVFVTGLKASKHADIRTRLLTRMENERPDAPVTLQTLIDEFQQLVNLKADTSLIEHPASSKAAATPCWQCGQMHFVKDCTYSSHLCKSCNRVGHKEGYCGCFTKTSNAPAGDNSNQKGKKNQKKKTKYHANIVHTVNHTGNLTRFVTTMMNGRQATLQLDSDLEEDPLPLLGEFTCLVGVNDVIKPGLCRVTSVKGLNLFGSEWMDLFEMWTKPLSSFINQVNQSNSNSFSGKHFLMRFPEVFQDTLGHCQKAQISLHLKPDARPIFRPKRPVPYNAIPLVETELNRLQQLGIISPVDYSDWAAPIVAVRKPGGKVRICADYSTGLNSMLEAHNFPLPTPDDIFSKLAGSKAFSIIDLSDAYLQVEVDDASKRLLTINTHRGLFNFNRLAPGVKSAPGAFQQLMHTMIAGISGVEVVWYTIVVRPV